MVLPSEVEGSTNLISPHVLKSAYSYLSVEQRDNVGLKVSLRAHHMFSAFSWLTEKQTYLRIPSDVELKIAKQQNN